jgi:hypothetical protein
MITVPSNVGEVRLNRGGQKLMKKTIFQISIRVSDSDGIDKSDLDMELNRHGMTLNSMVIRAVKEYLEKLKGKEPV